MIAGGGLPRVAIRVVKQCGEVGVADDDDIAAASSIAAVGAAHGNELFPSKRDDAGAAAAGPRVYDHPIHEPVAHFPRTRAQRSLTSRKRDGPSTSPSASTAVSIAVGDAPAFSAP